MRCETRLIAQNYFILLAVVHRFWFNTKDKNALDCRRRYELLKQSFPMWRYGGCYLFDCMKSYLHTFISGLDCYKQNAYYGRVVDI